MNNNFNFIKTNINKLNMNFTMKVVIILLILIICIIFLSYVANYSLYYKDMNKMISPILIPDVSDARDDYSDIAKMFEDKIYDNVTNNNTNFTVSMWIYIKDWKYNYDFNKIIFSKYFINDNQKKIFSPIIYLDKYNNNLIYQAHIYDDIGSITENSVPKLITCAYNDIPIQSWVNIVFTTYDKTVNLYINGSLAKKCNFKNIGYQGSNYKLEILPRGKKKIISDSSFDDESDENLGLQGFSGDISKLQYISKTLNYSEIRKIYENGPYN